MTLCTYGPEVERKPLWIIKFDAPDMGDLHYTVEADAMREWDRLKDSWTCTLFVTATFVDYDKRRKPPDWDHRGVNTPLDFFAPRR